MQQVQLFDKKYMQKEKRSKRKISSKHEQTIQKITDGIDALTASLTKKDDVDEILEVFAKLRNYIDVQEEILEEQSIVLKLQNHKRVFFR